MADFYQKLQKNLPKVTFCEKIKIL